MSIEPNAKVWFVTGSQHLYGEKVLNQVNVNSQEIALGLSNSEHISTEVVFKPTVTTPSEITRMCQEANMDDSCIGIIFWMHTFSPSKMWIDGLLKLQKPWMHLHTQFNVELPWHEIDMNFMNLNQSAHGCREFGFIGTRLGIDRHVVAGHWQTAKVQQRVGTWVRVATAWSACQTLKVARFGDNMRQVAVTEGNKVSAQIQFGYEVHAYSLGALTAYINAVSDADVASLVDEYVTLYNLGFSLTEDAHKAEMLRNEARLELGLERFLINHQCGAFTNTFEDLTGMSNLPGLATQRLMAKGYGYGGEGDWKTAAMVRIMKVMSQGLTGGNSFMEDYTYHFGENGQVLGAHMLEVCPSITDQKPILDVHRHTIGCKADIARLKFTAASGPSINVTTIDLGNRFRMIVNKLETVQPPQPLVNLPVAHALWNPLPSLETSAEAWILAGGAHHSSYSQAITPEMMELFASMAGIEVCVIDELTTIRPFKEQLRNNDLYFNGRIRQ